MQRDVFGESKVLLANDLEKWQLLFANAKQKVTVLFTDEGMNKTPTFPRETETDKGNDNAFDAT